MAPVERPGCCAASIEWFQNSRALLRILKGGNFLRRMPLGTRGSGVRPFWNRYRRTGGEMERRRRARLRDQAVECCPLPV
jgi:hypothetical protein